MARTLPFRLRHVAAAMAVIVAIILIWSAYQSVINTTDPSSQTLPIIRADSEPFRVLPDDPGGIDIPNQGSRLFQVLNAENADELALSGITIEQDNHAADTIESTASEGGFALPEMPEAQRESLFDEIDTLKDKQVIEEDPQLIEMTAQEKRELQAVLQAKVEKNEQDNNVPAPAEKQEPAKTTESGQSQEITAESDRPAILITPARKPEPPVQKMGRTSPQESQDAPKQFSLDRILAQEPVAREEYYLQLASLKTEADARVAYARLRDNFPKLVAGAGVVFPKADLGQRGTFYRVRIGPLSEAEAKRRCDDYRASAGGGTCLVVSR